MRDWSLVLDPEKPTFSVSSEHKTTYKRPGSYSLPYSLPSLWKIRKIISQGLSTLTIWSRNVTTSTREPPTCAWIRADIRRQDGAICSKNRKIVPYHRCARIPRLTVSVPDYGSCCKQKLTARRKWKGNKLCARISTRRPENYVVSSNSRAFSLRWQPRWRLIMSMYGTKFVQQSVRFPECLVLLLHQERDAVKNTQENLSTLTIWSRNVTTSTREPLTCAWIRADIWCMTVRIAQFVLKIEKLSHIIGARESRDLRSPSPIMAPDKKLNKKLNKKKITKKITKNKITKLFFIFFNFFFSGFFFPIA